MRDPNELGTTEAARIAGVSTRTIAKWVDSGMIKSFLLSTVGNTRQNKYRRVLRNDLVEFLKANNIPVKE